MGPFSRRSGHLLIKISGCHGQLSAVLLAVLWGKCYFISAHFFLDLCSPNELIFRFEELLRTFI